MSHVKEPSYADDHLRAGDHLLAVHDYKGAVNAFSRALNSGIQDKAQVHLSMAQCYLALGRHEEGHRELRQGLQLTESYRLWLNAATLISRLDETILNGHTRAIRVALLADDTSGHMIPMLRAAALRVGLRLEVYEAAYGQYQQEIIDSSSGLYHFKPQFIVIAASAHGLGLPFMVDDPEGFIANRIQHWRRFWQTLVKRTDAWIVQHNYAIPVERPLGHLTPRLPGSRTRVLEELNLALASLEPEYVSILDCEWLSCLVGKSHWFDDRLWYLAKQAISPSVLPLVSRHTMAIISGHLGLARKCLALDLDNTLWGGVIGEDGLTGIQLGEGPAGEAYADLQSYILELKHRGVLLAICSKNNKADVLEVFERHRGMRLSVDDFAVMAVNWRPKTENLREIARELNIGLDAIVFMDDSAVERELVRQQVPQVEIVELPDDLSGYKRALADCLAFESPTFTAEDASRTEQYRARAEARALETAAPSMEDFYRSLAMKATVRPFDEESLPRVVQLIGKVNQFNLTTRRHSLPTIRRRMADPRWVHLCVSLRDRFGQYGLVGLLMAGREQDEILEIDTFLLSCRVIGRTLDRELLMHLCGAASNIGANRLRGVYVPTEKNSIVRDLYAKLNFSLVGEKDGTTVWDYDIRSQGMIVNEFCGGV